MSQLARTPSLFPTEDLSFTDAILQIISNEPDLKARQVAYRLKTKFGFNHASRHDVNHELYGRLRDKVIQTSDYRWHLKSQQIPANKIVLQPLPVHETTVRIHIEYSQPAKMGLLQFIKQLFK